MIDLAQVLTGVVLPSRRRELAAAMLARTRLEEASRCADLAPPSRRTILIDGREAWEYSASAIIEICEWIIQASDSELDLISVLDDGNALMDSTVFLHLHSGCLTH